MTTRPLWLSLFSGIAHLAIGLPELLPLGPHSLPTSWVAIYDVLPDWAWWIWPGLFAVTGVVALFGACSARAAWAGFRASSTLFGVWGTVGAWTWLLGKGGNPPGSVTMIFLAVVVWLLSDYVMLARSAGKIDAQVAVLAEKVEGIANGG